MSARSLNKVILIGNLTRDPETHTTSTGKMLTTISLATNRNWKVDGVEKEIAEFHDIVTWGKLAEICAQILYKGAKAYFEGRLETNEYTTASGVIKESYRVVAREMMLLSEMKKPSENLTNQTSLAQLAEANDSKPL